MSIPANNEKNPPESNNLKAIVGEIQKMLKEMGSSSDENLKAEASALKSLFNKITTIIEVSPTDQMMPEWLATDPNANNDNPFDIQHGQASPNEWFFFALTPFSLDMRKLTPKSIKDHSTYQVMDILENIDQIKSAQDSRLLELKNGTQPNMGSESNSPSSPSLANLSAEDRTKLGSLLDLFEKLRDNHYKIIAELLSAHLYLMLLYSQDPDFDFILFKKKVEILLVQYNTFDPYYVPLIEENFLRKLRAIPGTIAQIRALLMGKTLAKNIPLPPEATPSESKSNTKSDTNSTTVSINLAKANTSLQRSVFAVQSYHNTLPKVRQGKDAPAIVRKVALINLDNTANPITEFDGLETAVTNYILEGLNIIASMKTLARNLNFNLNTMAFGSFVDTPNTDALDEIRAKVQKYLKLQLTSDTILNPKIFVLETFKITIFHSRYLYGDILTSMSLLAGEKQELRMKTTETVKSSWEATQSVFESSSTSIQQSLAEQVKTEKDNLTSKDTDTNTYIESSLNAGGELNYPVASGHVEYNTASNNTENIKENRTNTMKTLNNTLTKSANTTTTKRDINTASTNRQSYEKTDEHTQIRLIENRNPSSVLTVFFTKMLREFHAVTTLDNLQVLFHDGISFTRYSVGQFARVLPELVGDKEEQAKILNSILLYGKVIDYKDRELTVIEPSKEGYLRFLSKENQALLSATNQQPESVDQLFAKYEITGPVIAHKKYVIPCQGIAAFPTLAGNSLDRFEYQKEVLAVIRAQIENKNLAVNLDVLRSTITFVEGIKDEKLRLDGYFMLLRDFREIYEKIMMIQNLNGGALHNPPGSNGPKNFIVGK